MPNPNQGSFRPRSRAGFTIVECMVALALLMILSIVVAQAIVWGVQQRARTAARLAATELAANVLEAARAQPFDKLDQKWADAQQIPSDMETVLFEAKLTVTVSAEPKMPHSKRVTAEVSWSPAKSLKMTTLLTGRESKKAGTP